MKTKLVRIGNSRGIRLPKPLIEQAALGDDVELQVSGGAIIISRSAPPREGWAESAAELVSRKQGELLHLPTPTRFDDEEWES